MDDDVLMWDGYGIIYAMVNFVNACELGWLGR